MHCPRAGAPVEQHKNTHHSPINGVKYPNNAQMSSHPFGHRGQAPYGQDMNVEFLRKYRFVIEGESDLCCDILSRSEQPTPKVE